jgi:hypothetical protein
MGAILNAVLFGLFSSVFWISFAFGLFKREQRKEDRPPQDESPAPDRRKSRSRRRRRPS